MAALDFDSRCTVELIEYDAEIEAAKEKRLIEALMAGMAMSSVNKIIPHK